MPQSSFINRAFSIFCWKAGYELHAARSITLQLMVWEVCLYNRFFSPLKMTISVTISARVCWFCIIWLFRATKSQQGGLIKHVWVHHHLNHLRTLELIRLRLGGWLSDALCGEQERKTRFPRCCCEKCKKKKEKKKKWPLHNCRYFCSTNTLFSGCESN